MYFCVWSIWSCVSAERSVCWGQCSSLFRRWVRTQPLKLRRANDSHISVCWADPLHRDRHLCPGSGVEPRFVLTLRLWNYILHSAMRVLKAGLRAPLSLCSHWYGSVGCSYLHRGGLHLLLHHGEWRKSHLIHAKVARTEYFCNHVFLFQGGLRAVVWTDVFQVAISFKNT